MIDDLQRTQQARLDEPVAVIDIGSNSVRLVVYCAAKRSPTPVFNEKVLCGLGRTLGTTGKLCPDGIQRALDAVRRFRALADLLEAVGMHVVATAAAREAKNGPDFIEKVEALCGTNIEVLSGRREAQLAAAGVISGIQAPDGLAGDLGGGSLELMNIKDGDTGEGVTLPLGGLRLIDLAGGSLKKATRLVDEALDTVDWLGLGKGRPLYVIGGTWRAFARLHMAHKNYPLSVMHGYRITQDEALDFARVLDGLSPTSMEGIDAVSKARRETVPYGSIILERLIRQVRPSAIVVSAFGIREGLLYSLLDEGERARDPLLAACEELAVLRSRSPANARELTRWTDALFTSSGIDETNDERRLRHAACLLSDIGWRAHPDYRSEESLNTIAHGSFAGVDHPGRAFLAMAVYYRHAGMVKDEQCPRLIELLGERGRARARVLGAALRSAHMLSASMPGVIGHTPVSFQDDALVLTVPERFHMLDGERLHRRFSTLARELDLEPKIRRIDSPKRLAV